MSQFKNAMEIFKLLDKSNCKKCNKPTCLAFAGAVFTGEKELSECPEIDKEIIGRFKDGTEVRQTQEQQREEYLALLKKKILSIDMGSSAKRLDAEFKNYLLTIECLGKKVSVDQKGNIITDIHVHSWLAIPVLDYIIEGAGIPVSGKWVPFRELKGGKTWYRLFGQMCEKPLKRAADTYTDLFEDMLRIFKGKEVENHYSSDISLVLHPLPKIPLLICYFKPEDQLESDLKLFFDSTAEQNLRIESLYSLGTGLVIMFQKIALRHGQS